MIRRTSKASNKNYNSEYFKYNTETDTYSCPQENILRSNGSTYKGRNYKFKQYKTNKCKTYPAKVLCTTSKGNGEMLQRSEFRKYIEKNVCQVLKKPKAYKKRQAIVENHKTTMGCLAILPLKRQYKQQVLM